MQIKLKNGEVVKLDWNWLVVERVEEELGNIEELAKLDEKEILKKGGTKFMGNIVYAIIQANLDKEYGRNEILKLVEFEDIERIVNFAIDNEEKITKVVGTKK